MLKFYLSTVIIFMIILSCEKAIFIDAIRKNGWLDDVEKAKMGKWQSLFVLSAVPVLRLFFVIFTLIMASNKKDDFMKKMGKEETHDE